MQPSYFTVGLPSVIDTVMAQALEVVLEQLPLHEGVSLAIYLHSGKTRSDLHYTIAYQQGRWAELEHSSVNSEMMHKIYL